MNYLRRAWEFLTKPTVYWRIFSLLLAITLWLLAAGDGTLGEAERIISLGVEVHNLPPDLILVDPPEAVKVRIRGLSPILNRGEDFIDAKIDLAGAAEGTETYDVVINAPAGIEVLSVMPRFVSVYTEELVRSPFPVTLALLGVDPNRNLGGLKPVPAVITVMGARSILERVDHVVAYLNLDSKVNVLAGSFPVQALDSQGRSLSMVAIDPPAIRVELEVEEIQEPNGEE